MYIRRCRCRCRSTRIGEGVGTHIGIGISIGKSTCRWEHSESDLAGHMFVPGETNQYLPQTDSFYTLAEMYRQTAFSMRKPKQQSLNICTCTQVLRWQQSQNLSGELLNTAASTTTTQHLLRSYQ